MSHIFISYSKHNIDYAQRLKDKLLAEGFNVWIDEVIEPSDNWWESIVVAIESCAACIVILTPESKRSKWVQREVALAERGDKPLFPLLRDGDNWPLFVLTQYELVTNGQLPPDRFYTKLANYSPRTSQAAILTPPPPPPAVGTPFLASAAQPISPLLLDVTEILPPPFEWCAIPAGQVTLELEKSGNLNKPTIFPVAAFKMAKYPITNAQYAVFVQVGYADSQWWDYSIEAKSWHEQHRESVETAFEGDTLPRTNVSWYDAVAFCRWLSAHSGQNILLPTEQQWQQAAQGIDERKYPWGNEEPDNNRTNFAGNIGQPTPVTHFLNGASPFGVMDMSGNVWEWCLNEWGTGRINLDNSENYNKRVLRGGAWYSNRNGARAAYREWNYEDGRDYYQGFRLSLLTTSDD